MASIERTAYPRFKKRPISKELRDVYSPTPEENKLAHKVARGPVSVLSLLVMLKSFQRLGYFPRPKDIPIEIVTHIRTCLNLSANVEPNYNSKSIYRHQKAIRDYLNVRPYGKESLHIATTSIYKATQVMDNPADLINVSIEVLIKERCELPAFSTLDRLARRIRTLVNHQLFNSVFSKLTPEVKQKLDQLLLTTEANRISEYNFLKEVPKSATLSHMKEIQNKLHWLTNFIEEIDSLLENIPNSKIKHFALEAKALDVSELKDFKFPKRYTLLLCMTYRSKISAIDSLVEMFLKRIRTIHNKGKEELELLREKHRSKTENLISVLAEVLDTTSINEDDTLTGQKIKELLGKRGGIDSLKEDCESISSYNGNNYLPLLWKFYKSHRKTLFRLISMIEIDSTTQDQSLLEALQFLRDHENRKIENLQIDFDLSFANEQWKKTIYVPKENNLIYRKHLEICIFSYLASELKTGDLCVKGSENFADYREQLLPWDECKPMVAEYCKELGFSSNSEGFVQQLKHWLEDIAQKVDISYPDNGQVIINENGEPTLRKIMRKEQPKTSKALEAVISQRLPERNVLDILCNVAHWTKWTRHFGPLSGSDPKIENAMERYIITSFGYGCNLGPTQTSKHMKKSVTPHMISFINRRHINASKIDEAIRDILNQYNQFSLPKLWGDGKSVAADGTKFDLYEENLISEYHIRYGGTANILT